MPPITDPNALAAIAQQQRGAAPAANPMAGGLAQMPGSIPRPPVTARGPTSEDAVRLSIAKRNSDISQGHLDLQRQQFAAQNTMQNAPGDPTKTGDDYLDTLPGGRNGTFAKRIKMMSEGRIPAPTQTAALRSPIVQLQLDALASYDPTFDFSDSTVRSKTRQNYTSGKAFQAIQSLNMALGHLGSWYQNSQKLGNTFSPGINAVKNFLGEKVEGKAYTQGIDQDIIALADELPRVFSGTGGALEDRQKWIEKLSRNKSPEQFRETAAELVDLLSSRVNTLAQGYEQGMGRSRDPMTLLNPHAQQVFNSLGKNGDPSKMGEVTPKDFMAKPPIIDELAGATPSTTQKLESLPAEYQAAHRAFMAEHPPGTLKLEDYKAFRQQLDQEFKPQLGGATTNMDTVGDYVNHWNQGKATSTVPKKVRDLTPIEQKRAKFSNSAFGTGLAKAANAASFGLPMLAGGQDVRDNMKVAEADHPTAAMTGDIAGSILGMGGLERTALKGLTNPLVRDIATNAVTGGVRGFNEADTGQGGTGALEGAGAGTAAALGGQFVTKGLNPIFSKGFTDARDLVKGIKPTTFQRLGLGEAEAAMSGVPVVQGARKQSIERFNLDNARRAMDNVANLKTAAIDTTIPKGVKPGTALNEHMNGVFNQAYDAIKPQILGSTDATYLAALKAAKAAATTPEKKAMFREIEDAAKLFNDPSGMYNGDSYAAASQRLRSLVQSFSSQAENQGSVAAQDMARVADGIRKQMQQLVSRKTPEVGADLKNIERGWAHSMRIEDATNRALATNLGVYAPGQYLQSIKKLDTSAHKGATARGKAFDQPYGEAASNVLGESPAKKLSLKEMAIAGASAGGLAYSVPPLAGVAAGVGTAAYAPGLKDLTQVVLTGKRPKVIDNEIIMRGLEDYMRQRMQGQGDQ